MVLFKNYSWTLWMAALLLLTQGIYGQEPAVVGALQGALVGQTLQVRVAGVHAATEVLLHPIDTRIVAGAVQKRGLDLLRGSTDRVLPVGSAVQVLKVEAARDNREDILRVTVRAAGGGLASMAFVCAKATLATLSRAQAAALLSPVLEGPALVAVSESPNATSARSADLGPTAAVTSAAPSAPPAAAAHPSATQLEFPPAAPGYPALHASEAAKQGCWWTPALIEALQVEMLVQQCDSKGSFWGGEHYTYVEDHGGVGMQGNSGEVSHIIDIVSKPADEPISAAIRQRYISKLKSPAARASCVPRREGDQTGPVEMYDVVPTGAYSRQARFHRGDDSSEDPCPGLAGNDALSMFFEYNPENSKTHFLYFVYQDEIPVSNSSVRFRESDTSAPGQQGSAVAGKSPAHLAVAAKLDAAPSGPPQAGVWSYAQTAYTEGNAPSAATSARFQFQYGAALRPSTLVLGCDIAASGGPELAFRATFPPDLVPPPSYFSGNGRLVLPGLSRQFRPSLTHAGKQPALLVPLTAADAAALALDGSVARDGVFISFNVGIIFKADLPPKNAALMAALSACHMQPAPETHPALTPDRMYHLELARVALGMTVAQVREALGTGFQYSAQVDARYPGLSFLTAWGVDSSYAVTLVDDQVAGFGYARDFPQGARPLESNVIAGITAKAWQPIAVRPGFSALWIADTAGRPQLRPNGDSSIHPCARLATGGAGPLPEALERDGQRHPTADRIVPGDFPGDCGVTIASRFNRPSPNNGEVESIRVNVGNDVVLRRFMQTVNAVTDQQKKAVHDKLNSIPSPF